MAAKAIVYLDPFRNAAVFSFDECLTQDFRDWGVQTIFSVLKRDAQLAGTYCVWLSAPHGTYAVDRFELMDSPTMTHGQRSFDNDHPV